jgi:soluble cytochrome b562
MLRPSLPLLLTPALLLLPAAQESPDEHEHTELEERMEEIESAVKRLRRSLRDDANRADSLALVVEMQRATLASKGLAPKRAATLEGEARARFEREYRRTMVDLLSAQLELEAALLDGDLEAAKAAFTRVRDFEDSGHERFSEEE